MPNVTGLPGILQEMTANQEVVQSQSFVLQSRSIAAQVAHRLALDQDPEFNPRLRETPLWRSWLDATKTFVKDGAVTALQQLGLAQPKPAPPAQRGGAEAPRRADGGHPGTEPGRGHPHPALAPSADHPRPPTTRP